MHAELLDTAGRVERAADVEAVLGVGARRGQVLTHPGPHVALPVLVHPYAVRVPGREATEEAADEEHDLAVGVVVAVTERQLDVLVPPLRPVPHAAVVQEVLLQLGEPGTEIADLHPDGVAVQRRLLLGGRRVRGVRAGRFEAPACHWNTWSEERSTRTSSTPGVSSA